MTEKQIKQIKTVHYAYNLPEERIAQYPLRERDLSKLLIYKEDTIAQARFCDLPDYLEAEDMLVYNNTKVIQARLYFRKESGAQIEVFCLEPHLPASCQEAFEQTTCCVWKCMVGNLKKWKDVPLVRSVCVGEKACDFTAELLSSDTGMMHYVRFNWDNPNITFAEILAHAGELPIPPYLNRATEPLDTETYQTVYSHVDGSVAAPTAGLHFTADVLRTLALKGIKEREVTLHVGAGTFQPVKAMNIGNHVMHAEMLSVNRSVIADILQHKGRLTAVGTTSIRTLESLYYLGCHISANPDKPCLTVNQWEPYEEDCSLSSTEALQAILDYLTRRHLPSLNASTQMMIAPGFRFRFVDKLLTNFHQPQSTLLLLVAAFVGEEQWQTIYRYALDNDFRFLSYGDSSLLMRN
ncbi:MAG: S-adenosylmethionine:tRNA ribosyltransferase-isomerase [Prevotellaceae bacterium]|nr:S-adenosylmethionine:tRNA ribosyltransferase-isomerase [Prevotellaceae bacterium]